MIRAISTRKSPCGYEKLGDEAGGADFMDEKLKRTTSVSAGSRNPQRQHFTPQIKPVDEESQAKPEMKLETKTSKASHPLFSFFDARKRKKKATAKPEVARYLEYLKEGGVWDPKSNMPVLYHK